jgi:hypothetical protein
VAARVFLLSPANCNGKRARLVLRPGAGFDLAVRLRTGGAPLGEVFSFMSGLYFRGKLAYARAFARTPAGRTGVLVITPGGGLRPADDPVDLTTLAEYARIAIDHHEPRYRTPLAQDAHELAAWLGTHGEAVLLGSIATDKYVDVLTDALGSRLRFPGTFVGRGDMSRGGLMLRCAADRQELRYISVAGAVLNGKRPPKLEPRRYPKALL